MELNEIITSAAEKIVRDQIGNAEYHANKEVELQIQDMVVASAKEIIISKKPEILKAVSDYFENCEMQVDSRYGNISIRFVSKDPDKL